MRALMPSGPRLSVRLPGVALLVTVALTSCRKGSTGAAATERDAPAAYDAEGASDAREPGDAEPERDGAAPDASAGDAAGPTDAGARSGYGTARRVDKGVCAQVTRGGMFLPNYVSMRDLETSFVDGDDLLALVNRSPAGTLAPDYAPADMVSLHDGTPRTVRQCEIQGGCLRRAAYEGYRELRAEMLKHGMAPRVDSPFRSYWNQCGTFVKWADRPTSSFCSATEQSALPGHSQHQLGTTVDMWTEDWAREDGGVFRDGFGCTRGGLWLAESAWRFGFVVSYPIHPDDRNEQAKCQPRWDHYVPINPRTGYRYEPWHLRFIGKEHAQEFHDEWAKSGEGTPAEITLEQFIRRKRGLRGDADLPVCDGCSCGACATLARAGEKGQPCGEASLLLDDSGSPVAPETPPTLVDVKIALAPAGKKDAPPIVVEIKLRVPAHTLTQPPVMGDGGPYFMGDASYLALVPYKKTAPRGFEDLPGAYRVGVEPASPDAGRPRWPWRASLAKAHLARTWNRANLYLPGGPGEVTIKIGIEPPPGTRALRVALLKDGQASDPREVALP